MNIIQQITTVEQLYKNPEQPTGNVIVDAVVEYARLGSRLTGEDAATCLNVDQRWLSQSVKIFVGVTLPQFLWQWRLYQALDLLDDESLSYEQVASRTGFASTQHLSDSMFKFFKVTAFQYRTQSVYNHSLSALYNSRKKQQEVIERVKALKKRKFSFADSANPNPK